MPGGMGKTIAWVLGSRCPLMRWLIWWSYDTQSQHNDDMFRHWLRIAALTLLWCCGRSCQGFVCWTGRCFLPSVFSDGGRGDWDFAQAALYKGIFRSRMWVVCAVSRTGFWLSWGFTRVLLHLWNTRELRVRSEIIKAVCWRRWSSLGGNGS